MTILEIAAARVPPGRVEDTLLSMAVEEAEQKIRTYCNLSPDEPLPTALNFVAANMAVDLIRLRIFPTSEENGPIKSVSMGDVSYSFDTTSGRATLDRLLLNYESDLKKYRRVKK